MEGRGDPHARLDGFLKAAFGMRNPTRLTSESHKGNGCTIKSV
jgi:hypothetical protein